MLGKVRVPQYLAVAIALYSLFLADACSKKQEVKGPPPAVPVTVALAAQKEMPLEIDAIGNVEAYNTVQIKSQVTGQLMKVNFREGQDLNKGDLMFVLDRRPLEADLRRAEATLAKDAATAENDKAQAARYAALFKEGVVAKEQTDQMMTAANASEALVQADKAAVENARVQLEYASIYAPISARTGNLVVQLGNMVKANDIAMVTLNQVNPIYVTFTIPEQSLADLKHYMAQHKLTVKATIPNDATAAFGTLTFVDNTVDVQTGTIKLKGTFDNKDRRLWPGQFVNVTVTLAQQPNAIVVPNEAVQTGQQGQFVYVVDKEGKAQPRMVDVARTIGDLSVIAKGIAAGDQVVTDGQLRIVPGGKVDIKSGPNGTPSSQNAEANGPQGKRS
jgi:multidrug efflux system membrane fusion protein